MQDLEEVLLSDPNLKEIAIVPEMEREWLLEGPLLLLTDKCAFNLVKKHDKSTCIESMMIMQMIFPESCEWTGTLFNESMLIRANSIAIRSHPNCSILWKFRLGIAIGNDIEFLKEVQKYKKFNYHLFEYLHNTFNWDQLDTLKQMIDSEPDSFSPYSVLLTYLKKSGTEEQSDLLVNSLSKHQTDAYNEFFEGLKLWRKMDKGLPNLIRDEGS